MILLYIIIKDKVKHRWFKGGIVGTVMSNLGLEKSLEQMGVEFVRVPVGDRYIMSG